MTGLEKYFGIHRAVGPLSLSVAAGEFLSLLGPSGCGKTTTLRMIAGFEEASAGDIRIAGRSVAKLPIERRGIGMMFQSYALFPHLSVADNVGFGLRLRNTPRAEREAQVTALLDLVGLAGFGTRRPRDLSGGQQQRVSLARALAVKPQVLLLDEPLSSLDLKLREQMRGEIRRLQRSLGITAIAVTHDQSEAMAMSDRIAIMQDGVIAQIGTPREIYETPANLFVARFIGQCTCLEGEHVSANRFVTVAGTAFVPASRDTPHSGGRKTLVIRPEAIRLADDPVENTFATTVEDVAYLGECSVLTLRLPSGERLVALDRVARGEPGLRIGDTVKIGIQSADCVVVDEVNGLPHG